MTPTDPPKNAIGTNTAERTSAMPTSAPVIWPMDLIVASLGERPSSAMMRSTFSTTTMASSTSRPMASTTQHGQRVDRETESREHTERAEQDDGHGDGG